jgi:dUTP pyrophosphatase
MAILFIYAENSELKTLLENQVSEHRYTDSGFNIPILKDLIPQYKSMHVFNLGIKVAAVKHNSPMPCLLLPRSPLSKTPFRMANSLGLIDAGYRQSVNDECLFYKRTI